MTQKLDIGTPQEIGFYGFKENEHRNFTVLAGEGAPILTGGWIKLAKVQRFQRISLTIPEGFDPNVLTIPILFDEVSDARKNLRKGKGFPNNETSIKYLEWMAATHGQKIIGEPPYIEVYSFNGTTRTNLIPKGFQSVSQKEKQYWYITQITFDPNPLRDTSGERVRQAATVELTEIFLDSGAKQRAEKEFKAAENEFEIYIVHSKKINNIRAIAASLGRGKSEYWKKILEKNPKLGTNPEKPLKEGTKVKIPKSIFLGVPK